MTHPKRVTAYDLGAQVQLRATIIGTDGITPAQPSWFAFLVKSPNGSVATYALSDATASVVNPSTGAFQKDITIPPTSAAAGSWFYRAVATGMVQSAEEWAFLARRSFIL